MGADISVESVHRQAQPASAMRLSSRRCGQAKGRRQTAISSLGHWMLHLLQRQNVPISALSRRSFQAQPGQADRRRERTSSNGFPQERDGTMGPGILQTRSADALDRGWPLRHAAVRRGRRFRTGHLLVAMASTRLGVEARACCMSSSEIFENSRPNELANSPPPRSGPIRRKATCAPMDGLRALACGRPVDSGGPRRPAPRGRTAAGTAFSQGPDRTSEIRARWNPILGRDEENPPDSSTC